MTTEYRNETPSPEIIVPLKCECGNRDDTGVIAPPCSADCGRRMTLEILNKQDLADIKLVVEFVAGWWPGLEDGISSWGDDNALNTDPRFLAAVRLKKRIQDNFEPTSPMPL